MRIFSKFVLVSTLSFLLGPVVLGEILDRIVVIIDDRFIITLSDIRKERTLQSALGRNPGTDEAIVDALIERYLVDEEISEFREIAVEDDAVTERLRALRVPPGVSTEDLREALVGEFRRSQFMMERFQQFIRVSDEELQKYYNEVYAPEVKNRGGRLPPLEEVVDAIRQNRVAEKMNEEVDSWLAELRRRSVIEKIPN
jgi:hypothetical protein